MIDIKLNVLCSYIFDDRLQIEVPGRYLKVECLAINIERVRKLGLYESKSNPPLFLLKDFKVFVMDVKHCVGLVN